MYQVLWVRKRGPWRPRSCQNRGAHRPAGGRQRGRDERARLAEKLDPRGAGVARGRPGRVRGPRRQPETWARPRPGDRRHPPPGAPCGRPPGSRGRGPRVRSADTASDRLGPPGFAPSGRHAGVAAAPSGWPGRGAGGGPRRGAGRRVAGGARAGRGRSRGRRRRCPEPGAGAAVAAAEPGCLERAPGRGGLNGPPGPRRAGTDPPWDPRPRRPLSRVAFGHPPGAPAPSPLPAPRSRPDHDPGPSSYSLGRSSSPWGRIPGEGAPIPWSCVSVTREETQPKFLLSHIVKLENMPGTSSHAPAPPALPGGCARPATLVALRAGGQGR